MTQFVEEGEDDTSDSEDEMEYAASDSLIVSPMSNIAGSSPIDDPLSYGERSKNPLENPLRQQMQRYQSRTQSSSFTEQKNPSSRGRSRSQNIAMEMPVEEVDNNPVKNDHLHLEERPARKRGRAPSKKPCNKNAMMARENRLRKKEYIERIETKVREFQVENDKLKELIRSQADEIKQLKDEVTYLKNVLNNNTVITTLLKAMNESLQSMYPGSGGSHTIKSNRSFDEDDDGGGSAAMGSIMSLAQSMNPSTSYGNSNSSYSQSQGNGYRSTSNNYTRQQRCDDSTFARVPLARKNMPLVNDQDHDYITPDINCMDEINIQDSNVPSYPDNCKNTNLDESSQLDMTKNELSELITPQLLKQTQQMDYDLSDTDFSQFSNFDDYMLDIDNQVDYPSPFDKSTGNLFGEESLFNTLSQDTNFFDKKNETSLIDSKPIKNPITSEYIKNENAKKKGLSPGVCLHINSNKVSLEFCSLCHLNSLKTEIV